MSFGVIFLIQAGNLSLASADVKTDIPKPTSITSDTQSSTEQGDVEGESVCLTGAVAETLMNERSVLNTRQIEMAKRETALKALESKVQKDVDSLEVTQKTIQGQIDKMEKVAGDDILHLVEMYKTMKPKKAAEIFDSMDPGFAAGFLRQMDSTQAGIIM